MLDPGFRMSAKSPFDLIGTILAKSKQKGLSNAIPFTTDQSEKFNINIIKEEENVDEDIADEDKPTLENLLNYRPSDKKDQILEQISYEYPNKDLLNIAAKVSVSEIKRQKKTEEVSTDYQVVRQYQVCVMFYDRAKLLTKKKWDSAEVGALMYSIRKHLPLQKGGLK